MTNPTPTQIAEIARGLTKAQREAIERCWGDGNQIMVGGLDHTGIDTRVLNALRCKELLSLVAAADIHAQEWKLNALGTQVRNHLAQRSEA